MYVTLLWIMENCYNDLAESENSDDSGALCNWYLVICFSYFLRLSPGADFRVLIERFFSFYELIVS